MPLRKISEISAAEDEFCTKVWYNRLQRRLECIADGREVIVDDTEPLPADNQTTLRIVRTTLRSDHEASLRAAADIEARLGVENLGPWNEFEWGIIKGKLSALRWLLGEEWDSLCT